MPQVHFVKKARKDQPEFGIKAGESYYYWEFRYGGKRVSKTPPRQSQLTSGKMAGVYAATESVEDAVQEARKAIATLVGSTATQAMGQETFSSLCDDLTSALESAADDIRGVAEEYRESAQNMEDGFGHSTSQSDEMNEKADELESFADEVERSKDDIDGDYEPEEGTEGTAYADKLEEYCGVAEDAIGNCP